MEATSNSIHTSTACCFNAPGLSLFPTENLHWRSAFSSASRIHAVGGRSLQGGEDKRKTPRVSQSGRWSDQKRLLALFNRIETSISQQKSRNLNEKNAKSPKDDDDDASFQSVLEALSETPKKVGASNKQASGVDQEFLELEKMKLTQLKEVARARGIKGYSKLKKSELVDLLITQQKT